ncbi:MAG: hypothetical protein JW803_00115 [Endomicrobiales bacterium]|nr:hypothetical protein [Endomicrobiales bacterium]
MKMSKRIVAILLLSSILSSAYAEPTFVIDTPTASVLDYGGYNLNFRLFTDGGILTRLNFGVFRIVNLGFGWEMEKVIGNSEEVVVGPPALYLKIKAYEGGMVLPAFSLGYDGQGYFYDKDASEFIQKERGVFFVFGREMFFPGFNLSFGANMNDFKENKLMGFTGINYNVEDKVNFLVEYDNINYLPDARLNLGLRIFVTDSVSIDLAGRDIGAADRNAERIVRIGYLGQF